LDNRGHSLDITRLPAATTGSNSGKARHCFCAAKRFGFDYRFDETQNCDPVFISKIDYKPVAANMVALEQVGIFDPLIMQALNRQSEQLRAGTNYHLLGAMRRIEERDREKFSQPPNQ